MICRHCELDKPVTEMVANNRTKNPKRGECKQCKRERSKAYCPDKKRNIVLKFRYGITAAEADAMLEAQGGVCAICGRPPRVGGKNTRLYVDHDHATGVVRGLLCPSCNTSLEWSLSYRSEASNYIARASGVLPLAE